MKNSCITDLLGENGLAGQLDSGNEAIPAFKSALTACDKVIEELFDSKCTASEITGLRAAFTDRLLQLAWGQFLPLDSSSVCLIAVGGYGRGELFPGSDIDLMILTGKHPGQPELLGIQSFLTFLWDIGLEVGHSVRSVKQAVTEARADITVVTNIMEARLLVGDNKLFNIMRLACGPQKIWSSRKFFLGKWQELKNRYKKFDDTAYKLEPNLKESPGGLRDVQVIGWVAKRHFNADTLEELVGHDYLTQEEYRLFVDGLETLGRIRIALHLHTGRHEDRLLFDHQRAIAERLGFSGEGNKPIENFMQSYYRTVFELQRLNEMLLQHFQEDIAQRKRWGGPKIRPINKRFQSRGDFIEVTHNRIFEYHPFALLEIFLILEQNLKLKGVRASTIRLIRENRFRIDDRFRHDARAKSYFMEILRQPHGVTHEFRRMNRYGILAAYLPEFANIVGRMQYDLFHAYTVDEHTLFVVRNLRRFTVPEFHHEFPLCSHIMATLPKPELIYIAGLYHDIAKGRGGNHSELGAADARDFCERHGLSEYDTDLVCWLVENHLLMSQTSQKQDISDPEILCDFVEKVGDNSRLSHLYVLTVADMRATNPSLWNSWKANLLSELYNGCNQLFRQRIGSQELGQERIKAARKEARELLLQSNIKEEAIDELWVRLPDEYFLRHSPDDVAWHSRIIMKHPDDELIVDCRNDSHRGVTAIMIYTKDRINLFPRTAVALDQMGLDILDARILNTRDDYALDTFLVHDDQGTSVRTTQERSMIKQRLMAELHTYDAPIKEVARRTPRLLKQFTVRTSITFKQDDQNRRTIMYLQTTDRPGILSRVGQAFAQHNIRLQNARIATFGERVEDVFYISDEHNNPIVDSERLENIRSTIIARLSGDAKAA